MAGFAVKTLVALALGAVSVGAAAQSAQQDASRSYQSLTDVSQVRSDSQGVVQVPQVPTLNSREELACTVMMCMTAPGGWSSVQECVAPVQRFMRMVRKPVCPFGGSSGGGEGGGGGGGDNREPERAIQVL